MKKLFYSFLFLLPCNFSSAQAAVWKLVNPTQNEYSFTAALLDNTQDKILDAQKQQVGHCFAWNYNGTLIATALINAPQLPETATQSKITKREVPGLIIKNLSQNS